MLSALMVIDIIIIMKGVDKRLIKGVSTIDCGAPSLNFIKLGSPKYGTPYWNPRTIESVLFL